MIAEKLTGDSLDEDEGEEDGYGGQCRSRDSSTHLSRSFPGRLSRVFAPLLMTRNILEHDDGIVQKHTDPQRDPA